MSDGLRRRLDRLAANRPHADDDAAPGVPSAVLAAALLTMDGAPVPMAALPARVAALAAGDAWQSFARHPLRDWPDWPLAAALASDGDPEPR